jgi:ADP-ribose pyrophosphatase YjhB (NUDIX family)
VEVSDSADRPLRSTNVTFRQGSEGFNCRVAGLFLDGERVLLCRLIGYRDWTAWGLPGGRAELMESSEDAIRREVQEEIGEDVEVSRLLWVSESFYREPDGATHELCMCFLPSFREGSQLEQTPEFHGYDDGYKIVFRWFDIDQLHTLELRPTFLTERIRNLAPEVEHLIHAEGE